MGWQISWHTPRVAQQGHDRPIHLTGQIGWLGVCQRGLAQAPECCCGWGMGEETGESRLFLWPWREWFHMLVAGGVMIRAGGTMIGAARTMTAAAAAMM